MDVTITLGSWLIPFGFTLGSFARALLIMSREAQGRDVLGFGHAIVGIFMLSGASIVSLLAWLIWALLR